MNTLHDKLLCKKHPKIFKHSKSTFCSQIGRGFECGDGWFKIIDDLATQLDAIRSKTNIQVRAAIVKEKFGGLRFQCDSVYPKSCKDWREIVYAVVSHAENLSFHVCEECGKDGKLKCISGWYRTLCRKCGKHYGERQK